MKWLMAWLDEGVHLSVVISVVYAVCGAALYAVLRRRVLHDGGLSKRARFRARLVGIGVLLLVVVALCHAWRAHVPLLKRLHDAFHASDVYSHILWTMVAAVAVYFLTRGAEAAAIRAAGDIEAQHKARRVVAWTGMLAFLLCAILIWASAVRNIGVFLGIVGAGVALSLQETLLCMAGWVYIVIKKPFDIGDRIEIDGRVGDVIDISVFQTAVLEVGNWVQAEQSTGRIVNIPNSMVFRHMNCNYTKGFPFIWNELAVVVTFESDWRRARGIMLAQAQEETGRIQGEVRKQIEAMRGDYAIRYEQLAPIVYTHIADQGVALTLRYLSPVRKRRDTSNRICEGILDEFARESGVDFAYPTTRFFRNPEEGKPGTGGPRRDEPGDTMGESPSVGNC